MSDTTELFTGSSGTSEASPGPDHGSPGTAAPAGETVTDKPTRRGGSGLSGMLLADLQRLAQSMGITGTARMRKGQLVEAIQARQEGGAAYAREDGGGGHRERGGPVNGQQAAGSPAGNGSAAYDNSVQRGASAGAGAPRQREQDAMESDTPTQPALGDAGHTSGRRRKQPPLRAARSEPDPAREHRPVGPPRGTTAASSRSAGRTLPRRAGTARPGRTAVTSGTVASSRATGSGVTGGATGGGTTRPGRTAVTSGTARPARQRPGQWRPGQQPAGRRRPARRADDRPR